MTNYRAKFSAVQLEAEIEKCRVDLNWRKVFELADLLKEKPSMEYLALYLHSEAMLEIGYEQWQTDLKTTPELEQRFRNVLERLESVTDANGRKAGVALDAFLLRAKAFYLLQDYANALNNLELANLDNYCAKNATVLTLPNLRILAESYAIKGLSRHRIRKSGGSESGSLAECVSSLRIACEMSVAYLQKLEKRANTSSLQSNTGSSGGGGGGSGAAGVNQQQQQQQQSNQTTDTSLASGNVPVPVQPVVTSADTATMPARGSDIAATTLDFQARKIGPIFDQAIRCLPALLIETRQFAAAIEFQRDILTFVETESLADIRLDFMKQLTQKFLGSASVRYEYQLPRSPTKTTGSPAVAGSSKPHKYSSLNQFIPRNVYEEVILLLLISETIAARNAVLSQSSEFHETRESAYENIVEIYDLLTIATVRWNQTSLLNESLERAMKFSFEKVHVWRQFGLTLLQSEKYALAVSVLTEVWRLKPTDTSICLLIARINYEQFQEFEWGVRWSERAIECEKRNLDVTETTASKSATGSVECLARAELFKGIGYHLLATRSVLAKMKSSNNEMALEAFKRAVSIDPNDYLAWYYLALQSVIGDGSMTTTAIQYVHECIECRSDTSIALQLLAILLSAQKSYSKAMEVVEMGLREFPDCLNLLYIKSALEVQLVGNEAALETAKKMLEIWKNLYESTGDSARSSFDSCENNVDPGDDADRKSETRSTFQPYNSSDKDSCSLQTAGGHDLFALRVEKALSEMASSLHSSLANGAGLDHLNDGGAGRGHRAANNGHGSSHDRKLEKSDLILLEIWLLFAELYLGLDRVEEAESCVKEAICIFPSSHHVMHMRGLIHFHQKEWSEAKNCFQNAVNINANYVKSLTYLGLVQHYMHFDRLAELTLRKAAIINPQNCETWFNLGQVLKALNESEAASDCFQIALKVHGTSPILNYDILPICYD